MKHLHRNQPILSALILLVTLTAIAGCAAAADGLKTPTLAFDMPEKYNTPDGMTLDADNNILLSMPNFNDSTHPAKIMKISPDNKMTEFYTLPVHPDTGKAAPLGIDIASDGNLYIADAQSFFDRMDHKSRLLRVTIKDGKPIACDVVATGFITANAVACYGDFVCVTETTLIADQTPHVSGVYRFRLSEFDSGEPVVLKPNGEDKKHLIARLETKNPDWAVGANGLGFDAEGTLFCCNFGDAELHKMTLNKRGRVLSDVVIAQGSGMLSCDGLNIDKKTGEVYIADFLGNAVHKVDPKTGKVTTIAKNGMTDGKNGLLDRPSEVRLRDGRAYVSNIDLPFADNEYDKPHTISVIDLK